MLQLFKWFADRAIGTYLALALLLGAVGLVNAANTSWDVNDVPDMTLNVRINGTQTTGIVINPPKRNSVSVTFPTTTGGVLQFTQGTREELIYYSSATVASTTKRVTLAGVTRDLCWNQFTSFTGCGGGQIFTPGATVRLINEARLFNLKANIDRVNTFTGSGQITGNNTNQSVLRLNSVTTAQRDSFTYIGNGDVIYNSSVGTAQFRAASAWYSFGSGAANINATDAVAGKIQIVTLDNQRAKTATGSTNSQNVLTPRWTTLNGSGSNVAGYIPLLGSNGTVIVPLGGTGKRNLTTSGVLVGQGSGAVVFVNATSSGQIMRANANKTFSAMAVPSPYIARSLSPYEKIITAVGDTNFTTNYVLPANLFSTGSIVEIFASGSGASAGANFGYGLKIGSTEVCASDKAGTHRSWTLNARMTFVSNGAAGRVRTDCMILVGANGQVETSSGSLATVNTTTTNNLNVFNRSNGTNGYTYLMQFIVKLFAP